MGVELKIVRSNLHSAPVFNLEVNLRTCKKKKKKAAPVCQMWVTRHLWAHFSFNISFDSDLFTNLWWLRLPTKVTVQINGPRWDVRVLCWFGISHNMRWLLSFLAFLLNFSGIFFYICMFKTLPGFDALMRPAAFRGKWFPLFPLNPFLIMT